MRSLLSSCVTILPIEAPSLLLNTLEVRDSINLEVLKVSKPYFKVSRYAYTN